MVGGGGFKRRGFTSLLMKPQTPTLQISTTSWMSFARPCSLATLKLSQSCTICIPLVSLLSESFHTASLMASNFLSAPSQVSRCFPRQCLTSSCSFHRWVRTSHSSQIFSFATPVGQVNRHRVYLHLGLYLFCLCQQVFFPFLVFFCSCNACVLRCCWGPQMASLQQSCLVGVLPGPTGGTVGRLTRHLGASPYCLVFHWVVGCSVVVKFESSIFLGGERSD